MKDNTLFHFGTAERKFSCFGKTVAAKARVIRASGKTSNRRTRYFLRRTLAGQTQSEIIRVNSAVLCRYKEGFADLAEAIAWADGLFNQGKRQFRVNFVPREYSSQ